jgi:hypothetical protein
MKNGRSDLPTTVGPDVYQSEVIGPPIQDQPNNNRQNPKT